jgi:hypothetical protein
MRRVVSQVPSAPKTMVLEHPELELVSAGGDTRQFLQRTSGNRFELRQRPLDRRPFTARR